MATSWTCPRCGRWHPVIAGCTAGLAPPEAWLDGPPGPSDADAAEDEAIARYWRTLARHLADGGDPGAR